MANNLKLKEAKKGQVVTRFPPEASGYIHIGHAKAALVNFLLSRMYEGKMILRFDDTNPDKEKTEFEEAILHDLHALKIQWDIGPTYTSDYFPQMLDYAQQLIDSGKAYCDDTPQEEMQKCRFDGIPTACRENSVDRNRELWDEMLKLSEQGRKTCLRAKISIDNKNKALRDPVIYRCNANPHPRTGTKFTVYPTYDFACPIVDSLEGVSHALRTSEYNDRNDQYKWMCKALSIRCPMIDDFSRLNMEYTLMSKRKLTQFVEQGLVRGWDDPRMPTVRGLLRKGVTVEALQEFVKVQGMSKSNNVMEWEKIWNGNKKILDAVAPRYTCVDQFRIPATVEGAPELEVKETPLHKKNAALGNKPLAYSNKIFLEQKDVELLKEGEEVTLMDWGNAFVTKIHRDGAGNPTALDLKLHLAGDFKSTEYKLSWLADVPGNIPCTLFEFDHIITVRSIDKDTPIDDCIRDRTEYRLEAVAEEGVRQVKPGDVIQFQRRGFFKCDRVDPLEFFYIPDGHLKRNHLSAMARWGPPEETLEDRKAASEARAAKAKKEKEPAAGAAPEKEATATPQA
eukprot:TRINITY_DN66895_c0_g1_i1.p1 TRINITY_DN66895_c0_g1~~TRINITY_DN66895_c0_g1_i1.p1  ORF type:complete len:567 (-),score=113.96 TRINITY_DN66895_c0_g1_i1:61-1761(-)